MALGNNPTQSEVVKEVKRLESDKYDASNPSGFTSNTGTVTSVRVQAGTGLSSSQSTAQTGTLNTTIGIASGYKLPTTAEWNAKADTSAVVTSVNGKTGAVTGLATSNPNLLINSNFAINQRGQSSYTSSNGVAIYSADRWQLWSNDSITFNVSTKTLSAQTSAGAMSQYFESFESGKTYTLSIKLNNQIYTASGVISTNQSVSINIPNHYIVCKYASGNSKYVIEIDIAGGQTSTLDWVKLELGSIATEYTPPLIAEELPKCQRYFLAIGNNQSQPYYQFGYVFGESSGYARMILPCSMRINPTVSKEGNFIILASDATYKTVSSVTTQSFNTNCVVLKFSITSSMSEGQFGVIESYNSVGARILLNAEL